MNRVLRKTFSPKWEEMTRGWRKLYTEFHDRHSSPDLVKKVVMGGACCTHGGVLVENSKLKRPLGRLRHRFDDNIKRVSWK